jgi:hypothetical protein
VQQHLGAGRGEAPGRHHRPAALAGPDALGDAVDEEVDDLVLAEVTGREVLIVGPELLAELRHGRARQQQPPALVPEGVLDVPDRQAAREQLDRQPLQRLGASLQVPADLGAERLLAPGDLRRGVVDQPLRRLSRPARTPFR